MDLPDSNPKTRYGVSKPGIADVPAVALLHLGLAMRDGEKKYGRTNWREHNITASVYYNAAMRHLMSWWDGEENAEDSGVHHLGHAMACLSILVDAQAQNTLNDDRPGIPGQFAAMVKALTVPMGGHPASYDPDYHPAALEVPCATAHWWSNPRATQTGLKATETAARPIYAKLTAAGLKDRIKQFFQTTDPQIALGLFETCVNRVGRHPTDLDQHGRTTFAFYLDALKLDPKTDLDACERELARRIGGEQ